jgi:hypothetical protein
MTTSTTQATEPGRSQGALPVGAFLVGAAVSVALGVYASVHDPSERTPISLIFTGGVQMKVWVTTLAVLLAIVQLLSAMRMYGRISFPKEAPTWLGDLHRLSGTLAFLFTLPVAYTCLWAFGWNGGEGDARTLMHSLFGCLFYGAFAAKILVLRHSTDAPKWVIPVLGSTVFTLLIALFATSAVWFWTDSGFPSF